MKKLCMLFALLLLLTGCAGYKELNELEIVAGLYLDLNEDGTLFVTAETVDFTGGQETSVKYSAQGAGIRECMTAMMESCGKELYLSHAEVIVIGTEYAGSRLYELTEYILHDTGLRLSTAIVLSPLSPAADICAHEAYGDKIVSYALSSMLQNSRNTGRSIIKESYIAIRELYDIGHTTVLPVVTYDAKHLSVGGSAVVGTNGVVLLNDRETMYLNILNGTYRTGSLGLFVEGKNISVGLKAKDISLSCNAEQGKAYYHICAALSAEADSASSRDALERAVRVEVTAGMHDLYDRLRSANTDALGVLRRLRGSHPEQYKGLDSSEVFKNSALETEFQINTGEVIT